MENNKELFESIFNRNPGDEDTLSFLENIAGEHPYFSPAQFYLLLQTKKEDPAYKKQVQKTAALFNNNYWLNYLLTISSKPEPVFVQPDFKPEETIAGAAANIHTDNAPVAEETGITETEALHTLLTEEADANKISEYQEIAEASVADEAAELNEPATIKEEAVATEENILLTAETPVNEEVKINETAAITEEPSTSPAGEPTGKNLSGYTAIPVNENEVQPAAFPGKEITVENITAADSVSEAEEKKKIAEKPASEPLLFEPLHTSDYFASMGIKLSEEANSSDRLGKQLKSFTQWLKTMKKIDGRNADPLLPAEIATENIDNNIQSLAEKSNKEDDIITEAMADVLVQQGRISKAVEVLKKLSLLNPSKSTYFAAKIDQLKD